MKRTTSLKVVEVRESRRDKFLRLATPRVNRILNSIRLVGNLATSNYQWTDDDIDKMIKAVEEQLVKTRARFDKHKRGERPDFRFEEQF